MSAARVKTSAGLQTQLQAIPPVSWWNPQTVRPEAMRGYIQTLERACLENTPSADLRTWPEKGHAVNHAARTAMDGHQAPVSSSEPQCWLRALALAEKETLDAVELAQNTWQLSLAQRQLQAISELVRDRTRRVSWEGPPAIPVLVPGLPLASRGRPS